ncbi:MAG: hypothetical protein DRI54_07490 [Bacteroidetes bacterium]|nr:MAG: hypothetical protein DRI54_07490 [Bacteroidota bacterium]
MAPLLKYFKRIFIVFIIITGIVSVSSAQVHVIPAVGLNLSKMKFDLENGDTSPLTGYQVGASLRLGNAGFLQIGAFYHQYANRFEWIDSTQTENRTDVTINGALIPIQFGFSIYNVDILKVRLMAGIQLGIPTNVKPNELDLTVDDLNGSNVEIAVGFGVDIFRLVVDVNFGFAMNDLFADKALNSGKNLYTLNVGYLIGKM